MQPPRCVLRIRVHDTLVTVNTSLLDQAARSSCRYLAGTSSSRWYEGRRGRRRREVWLIVPAVEPVQLRSGRGWQSRATRRRRARRRDRPHLACRASAAAGCSSPTRSPTWRPFTPLSSGSSPAGAALRGGALGDAGRGATSPSCQVDCPRSAPHACRRPHGPPAARCPSTWRASPRRLGARYASVRARGPRHSRVQHVRPCSTPRPRLQRAPAPAPSPAPVPSNRVPA